MKTLLGMGLIVGGAFIFGSVISAQGAYAQSDTVDVEFTFDSSIVITLSSNVALVNNLMPGNAAHSNTIAVNVDTNAVYGYTLSAKVGGVGETDDSSDLVSNSSNATFTSLANSDHLTLANFDSNKWGYTTASTINDATTTYSGLLYNTDTILNATRNHSGVAVEGYAGGNLTNFTIGASADAEQTMGYYSNIVTFTAVANVDTGDSLMIIYDGNGLYFGGDPSRSTNTVTYDATTTTVTGYSKYSHTPNINDSGIRSGSYADEEDYNDVVTIPGASALRINLTYGGEVIDGYYNDYVSFWEGNHPDYNAYDDYVSGVQSCGNSGNVGGKYADSGYDDYYDDEFNLINTVQCTITGNTVTFGFMSDEEGIMSGYGYYAVVTGLDANGDEMEVNGYNKIGLVGAYSAPGHNYGVTNFIGWSEDPYARVPDYVSEYDVAAKLEAGNGDLPVTLYAVYEHAEIEMQYLNYNFNTCSTSGINVYDSRDNEIYHIKRLADGNCWMLDNLRLDLTDSTVRNTLSEYNTNATSESLASLKSGNRANGDRYAVSGFSSWNSSNPSDSFNVAKANADNKDEVMMSYGYGSGKLGTFYNYCAASAGSYCYDSDYAGPDFYTSQDICPVGWFMPSSNNYNEVAGYYDNWWSLTTSLQYEITAILSGGFRNGVTMFRQGARAWSSDNTSNYPADSEMDVFSTALDEAWAYPGGDRSYGNFVRCMMVYDDGGGFVPIDPDPGGGIISL